MKNSLIVACFLVFFFIIALAAAQVPEGEVIELSSDVTVSRLTGRVWLYNARAELPDYEGPVTGNGLIVISGFSAMLIDLPWNDDQTRSIAEWIKGESGASLDYTVSTHYHQDCSGGLGAAHEIGAESWAFHKTTIKLYDQGSVIPKNSFSGEKVLYCGDLRIELFYPGNGHTDDNIVAWIPDEKVLFAGCLVRAKEAADLGNIAEADLKAYPDTLKNLQERFKDAEIVVPGHGLPGGRDLIEHTVVLSRNQKR